LIDILIDISILSALVLGIVADASPCSWRADLLIMGRWKELWCWHLLIEFVIALLQFCENFIHFQRKPMETT
jgi:hypothetical protein